MFGSANINPDYTFTQSENRLDNFNSLKLLSNYFGESGVGKNDELITLGKKKSSPDELKSNNSQSFEFENEEITYGTLGENELEDEQDLYDGRVASVTSSFHMLAAAIGATGGKVTKSQLYAYLQSLLSDKDNGEDLVKEITFLKNLIAKFDTISHGEEFITSFSGVNDPQDYDTVTSEQLSSPFEIII